ncbi:S-adenosyl-L-methionine-dependent methyltransferase, partial [Teratosphaeria nubilosa]
LAIAALASPVSQQTISPVWGAVTVSVNHAQAITATVLLGYVWRAYYGIHTWSILPYLALVAFWMPAIQQYLFQYSSKLGPVAGPVLLGFASCHTIIIGCGYAAAQAIEVLDLQAQLGNVAGVALPAVLLDFGYFRPLEYVLARLGLPWVQSATDLLSPTRLQPLMAVALTALSPEKPWWLFSLGAPALLHMLLANPHFDGPYNMAVVNRDLAPTKWTLLDRTWSNTGYISVLEDQNLNYRVLRCDHSLLGGEWQLTTERRSSGWLVNEPIYAVFQMLEAVRLVETEKKTADSAAQALVVGLGIGTAPKSLMAHGIYTTTVELDPAVYGFAKQYFGMPSDAASGQVVLADAIFWADAAVGSGDGKYDYILHDVFTGGAEPLSLFTDGFLGHLRALLTREGVIAINYAGDLAMPLTARVLNTIDQVFDGQCKAFRDAAPSSSMNPTSAGGFVNVVVFCRNSPGEVKFRQPSRKDFLGSKSRETYLLPKAEWEVQFPLRTNGSMTVDVSRHEVLKKGDERLWTAQVEESAIRHWRVMRNVLPAKVWEL